MHRRGKGLLLSGSDGVRIDGSPREPMLVAMSVARMSSDAPLLSSPAGVDVTRSCVSAGKHLT